MKIQHAKNTFRRQGMFYNSSSLFVNWYNKWIGCIIIMSFKSGASVTKWPRWHCFKSCILTLIPRPLHWAATWHVLIASGMGCICRYQSSWQNWPWLPWAAVLDKTQFQVCSDWRFPEFFKGGKSSKPLPFWITILTKLSQLQWCPDGNFMMTSKDLWHQTTLLLQLISTGNLNIHCVQPVSPGLAVTASTSTYASEPQQRVRDFCVSLTDLSELRRALNFPSLAGNL